MRLTQLQARCRYWQERLKLKDWVITLRWMTPEDGAADVGLCTWFTEESTATISIYKHTDQESALVHELLHLCFDGHKPYEGYNMPQEIAINKVAEALLRNV